MLRFLARGSCCAVRMALSLSQSKNRKSAISYHMCGSTIDLGSQIACSPNWLQSLEQKQRPSSCGQLDLLVPPYGSTLLPARTGSARPRAEMLR